MAFQVISLGASPNDGTGDPFRTGGIKINSNFLQAQADFNTHSLWINSLGVWQASMYGVFSTWVQSVFENTGSGGGGGGGLTNGESAWLNNSISAAYTRLNNHSTWINSVYGLTIANSTNISSIGAAVSNQNEVFSTWIDSISAGGGGGSASSLREAMRAVLPSNFVPSVAGLNILPFGKEWQIVRSTNIASFWNPTTGLVEMEAQATWLTSLTNVPSMSVTLAIYINDNIVAQNIYRTTGETFGGAFQGGLTQHIAYQYINTTGTDSISVKLAISSAGVVMSPTHYSFFNGRVIEIP